MLKVIITFVLFLGLFVGTAQAQVCATCQANSSVGSRAPVRNVVGIVLTRQPVRRVVRFVRSRQPVRGVRRLVARRLGL